MNENHEVYVSLDLAKALKSLGFDWEVRSFYQEPKHGSHLEKIFQEHPEEHKEKERHDMPVGIDDWNNHEADDRIYYSCPTLAVARDWFREEMNIEIEPHWNNCAQCYITSFIARDKKFSNWREVERQMPKTFHEALEGGMLYVYGWFLATGGEG